MKLNQVWPMWGTMFDLHDFSEKCIKKIFLHFRDQGDQNLEILADETNGVFHNLFKHTGKF